MNKEHPPKWANRLFEWYADPRLHEPILGDMEEQFKMDLSAHGLRKAKWKYIRHIIWLFRPSFIRKKQESKYFNYQGMIQNYYKVSLRNILRNKTFSFLNVLGLSVGIASCILILIYVQNELSYDKYNTKYDRTYRVLQNFGKGTDVNQEGPLPASDFQVWGNAPIADALSEYFPQVEHIARFTSESPWLVEYKGVRFQENDIPFADASIHEVFDWNWIAGNPKTALTRPNTIILSEGLANKLFGEEEAVGKTIILDGEDPFEVTAVYEIPSNSHFSFPGFISMQTIINRRPQIFESWGYVDFYTYFTLNENTDISQLTSEMEKFREKYTKEIPQYSFRFEPLADVYLNSEASRQPGPTGNRNNILLFISVAIFILIIACINFMNLSTARSVERAKEVAIRKTIGSRRRSLIFQFLIEATLLTLISTLFAGLLVFFSHSYLEDLVGKSLPMEWLTSPLNLLIGVLVVLALGLVTGSYPTFVISKFKPIKVLKGSFKNSAEGVWLRKSLVVLQFSLSVILLIGTAVVYKQLNYLKSYNKGFDAEQVLVVDYGWDPFVQRSLAYIKSEFLSHHAVKSIAASRTTPGEFFPNAGTGIETPSGEIVYHDPALYEIDEDFIPTYQMEMIAGRNYSEEHPADSAISMILNEAAAKLYGYANPEEVVGKRFAQWGREGQVIGVVKDFNYLSLHQAVEPMALRYSTSSTTSRLSIELQSNDYSKTLDELESLWNRLVPNYPFVAYFNNANFNRQYESDERFGTVFTIFSSLAMFVACLGLFGLTIYSTNQRAKEIGVRKVLGASIQSIVTLLSYDFVKLFIVSLLISIPISFFIMDKWLENFAFRTTIEWQVFVISAVITLILSLITMSFRTVRAALSNPAHILKDE